MKKASPKIRLEVKILQLMKGMSRFEKIDNVHIKELLYRYERH